MKKASILLLLVSFLVACQKNKDNPAPPPIAITDFTPKSGIAGTSVTIKGVNFSTNSANNEVQFNGTSATVAAATKSQLSVTVPAGATTGTITVTVNGQAVTSSTNFIVLQSPTITNFSPANGIAGATIIITGTNFSSNASENGVKFNGTAAEVTGATATQLTVKVPSEATTGKISITVHGLTVNSAEDFTVSYPPTITDITPNSGTVGTTVTIIGTNFSPIPGENTVKFNTTIALVTSASSTQIVTTIPVGATTGKISVAVKGIAVTSQNAFTLSIDQWQIIGGFREGLRKDATAFVIGNRGYVSGGDKGKGGLNDLWQFDPDIPSLWRQQANFGGGIRSSAVSFTIGDKGYVGLGFGNGFEIDSTFRKDFWEFDPVKNQWTQKADYEGAGRAYAVGLSIGTKGYVGTGTKGTLNPGEVSGEQKDFWEYDPASNHWTRKADFGGQARVMAVGVAINGKGYVGTGGTYDGNTAYKDFWEYDPLLDKWTQKADFGGTARQSAIGFSLGNKGYLGTGVNRNLYSYKDFWEYDPTTDQWTRKADCGDVERNNAVGFSIGNKGYVVSGLKYGSMIDPHHSYVWEYTP